MFTTKRPKIERDHPHVQWLILCRNSSSNPSALGTKLVLAGAPPLSNLCLPGAPEDAREDTTVPVNSPNNFDVCTTQEDERRPKMEVKWGQSCQTCLVTRNLRCKMTLHQIGRSKYYGLITIKVGKLSAGNGIMLTSGEFKATGKILCPFAGWA